jgi:hypothetical protein
MVGGKPAATRREEFVKDVVVRDDADGGAGSQEAKSCFVATAAFEDEDHPTVRTLRRFRDRMERSPLGRMLSDFYWRVGPTLACAVSKAPIIRPLLKCSLSWLARHLPDR